MMTEVLADSSDPQLSKCLIHLPRKWSSDQLKTYLDEQVCGCFAVFVFVFDCM